MTTNRPLRVFLCHSSNDKPAVRELYQKLRAEPWIEPWLDEEELYPGQDWNIEIENAVEAADAIIVCLSKGSITKEGYVQKEIRAALDYADYKPEGTLFIIPVRLDECTPPKRLGRWQYADYFEGQREHGLERLLVSLKRRAKSLDFKIELPAPRNDLKHDKEQRFDHSEQEPVVYVNGQIIDGKYEVRKVLSTRATGQVYCVYDDVFERVCALKIFNNSAMSADSLRNEARPLLKISHPNIAQVYNWGVLKQSARFYLISEFVDGKELTAYTLPGNLLPVQKAIQVILELLSALEYLHPDTDRLNELRDKMMQAEIDEEGYEEFSKLSEQGLFHRDIKPSNIVLSPGGAKLIDFNIASKANADVRTYTGGAYMLPKRWMMPRITDGDLFATGIVLYELITGYHPYPDRQPLEGILPTSPVQYTPQINLKMAEIMLRAVSCDPQLRYRSARSFKQDILNLSEH